MLAHFQLSEFLLTKLNAVVLAHWPEAQPAETHKAHFRTEEMATLLAWHLHRSPTPSGATKYTSLQVRTSPLTVTLNYGSHFELHSNRVVLEHVETIASDLITVGGPRTVHDLAISIVDLELAHEFDKRLTDLKTYLPLAKAA